MRRVRAALGGFLVVAAVLGAGLPTMLETASAQDACFPPTASSYPPQAPEGEAEPGLRLTGGLLLNGDPGTLTVSGAVGGIEYCAILLSTPINLGTKVATAQGVLSWGLNVPSDFQLNALHHLDVYRQGRLVGAFDFCVNLQGRLAEVQTCSSSVLGKNNTNTGAAGSKALPRTGMDRLFEILRVAAAALAVGVLLLYLRRRRAAVAAAAT